MWVGELPTRVATIYALAFSPDNRTLYSGDRQGYVLAWDLSARTYRVLFRRPFPHAHPGHRGVNSLWPTPDACLPGCSRLLSRQWGFACRGASSLGDSRTADRKASSFTHALLYPARLRGMNRPWAESP